MYKAPFDIKDSQLYIDSLVIAKKKWPVIRTSNSLSSCKEWNNDFFSMIEEQMKLYSVGKGRLQTNN